MSKLYTVACTFLTVALCAFCSYAEKYGYRTQDLVNVMWGLVPESNCVYGHYSHGRIIVASVVNGRGIVCVHAKDPDLKKVFIETNRAYVDGDALSTGVYCYSGITQYEDCLGAKRTVRSFRELEGKEADLYDSLIRAANARKIQAEKDVETAKIKEEQVERKIFYKKSIDSQSLVVSNLVAVSPRIKKYIKKAQIDDDLWIAIRGALENDDWLPVLRLCPSNGYRGSKQYDVYPDKNELQKCAESLRKVEVPLVFLWNDKVPRFEVVEYDMTSGTLSVLKHEDIKRGQHKIGCTIDMQLGKRYLVCPVGGLLRLQKQMQNSLSRVETEMRSSTLQGSACAERYATVFNEFFDLARKRILHDEFFAGEGKSKR